MLNSHAVTGGLARLVCCTNPSNRARDRLAADGHIAGGRRSGWRRRRNDGAARSPDPGDDGFVMNTGASDRIARIDRSDTAETTASPIPVRTLAGRWLLAAFAAVVVWSNMGSAMAQDATAGQAVFRSQCSICHSVQPSRNQVGPSLFGVVGRPSGSIPGFRYSQANRGSGLIWDVSTLDRYITRPGAIVPHTFMTYGGLKDDQRRIDLIAYLSTLR